LSTPHFLQNPVLVYHAIVPHVEDEVLPKSGWRYCNVRPVLADIEE
jgi:hypothetical protein